MDLVVHPDAAGGLSNAATVIAQIGDLDVPALARLASVRSRSVARRLGWLLDTFRCAAARRSSRSTEGIGRIRIKVESNIAETDSFLPRKNIRHTTNQSSLHDLDTLLASTPPGYKPTAAADILMRNSAADCETHRLSRRSLRWICHKTNAAPDSRPPTPQNQGQITASKIPGAVQMAI